MICDENYEKWGGYRFFGGQTHLVHDTKLGGVVGPLKFYQISNFVIMVSIWRSFKPTAPLPHPRKTCLKFARIL